MASKFDEALEALKPKRHSGSFQKGFDPKRGFFIKRKKTSQSS